ncbi:MAG: MASE1 domain-containing protein, partial [Ferruginibacter sp.]
MTLRMFFFTGRTLEAIVGAYLFLRFVNPRPEIKTANQSIRLVLFTCLASSLLSSFIGSITIHYFFTESNFVFTFVAWWSGDILGLLIILSFYFARKSELQHFLSMKARIAEAAFLGVAF